MAVLFAYVPATSDGCTILASTPDPENMTQFWAKNAETIGCPYTFLTRCNKPTNGETFCPDHAKCDCGYPMAHNGDCDPAYLDWVDGWDSGYMAGEY